MGPVGPAMVGGMLLGGLLGVAGGMLMLGRGKSSTGMKAVLAAPALLGGALAGGLCGMIVGLLIDLLLISHSPLAKSLRDSQRFEHMPLRIAACANDLGTVRTLLARPLDEENARYLGRITEDCTLSINAKVPPGDEMLKLMLPVLYARYAAAPARPASATRNYALSDYCDVIENLISDLNAAKLRVVQSMGLPLHCRDGAGYVKIDRFIGFPHTFEGRRAGIEEVLRIVGGREGPFGQARSEAGRSLLDSVVDYHAPQLIIAALEAGVDPHRPDPVLGTSAASRWNARKSDKRKPLPGQITPSSSDIAAIDALMGTAPPGSKEIK